MHALQLLEMLSHDRSDSCTVIAAREPACDGSSACWICAVRLCDLGACTGDSSLLFWYDLESSTAAEVAAVLSLTRCVKHVRSFCNIPGRSH